MAEIDLSELSLADRLWEIDQLKQLKARYFRFVDTRDWAALVALFAPDCVMRSTVLEGTEYPPEFYRRVAERITPGVSVHHGHMPEITLTSAMTATGIWAMFDLSRPSGRMPGTSGTAIITRRTGSSPTSAGSSPRSNCDAQARSLR